MKESVRRRGSARFLFRILQGAVIGLGAVLPGVSGGVLCVIFGVYQPLMACLSNPAKGIKKHASLLLAIAIGWVIGFLGVARLLAFLLERYPDPSVCLFIGLIAGMLPSLYREAGEQGRGKSAFAAMGVAFAAVLALLTALRVIRLEIVPSGAWYLFCGFSMALSVIVPGLSFSTLLMPLGLYTPFIDGIGRVDPGVLAPGLVGLLLTMALLARAMDSLMRNHHAVMFHGVIGVVAAATLMIIPFSGFATAGAAAVNLICMAAGVACALALDKFNSGVEKA